MELRCDNVFGLLLCARSSLIDGSTVDSDFFSVNFSGIVVRAERYSLS